MSDGKTMVGTQISDERHQRWTEAIEESDEFASVAQAIRVGVEQVLFKNQSETGGETLEGEKLLSRIDQLEDEVIKTRSKVIEAEEETPTIEEISEEVVYRLAKVGQEEQRREGGWEDGF